MTTTNQWIPRPEGTDYSLPAWVVQSDDKVELITSYGQARLPKFWRPATVPAGPVVERTQGQADDDACWDWVDSRQDPRTPSVPETWHAALNYRDAANRADLEQIAFFFEPKTTGNSVSYKISGSYQSLRKRAGLTP